MKGISTSLKTHDKKKKGFTIAVRIGLLIWMVAVATLFIFVVVTIPQQKNIYIENLFSKSNGLAVSLHDVAAGAAINEDFASVVSAAQTLLAGDPDLEFLVVMKNNGFSLVIEQDKWSVQELTSDYWLDRKRESSGLLETVPVVDKRVFHFIQPFDYSGIQWGWIHVGLSLQSYDQSISSLYLNTVILGLFCIVFSLFFSAVYAKQIVKPIIVLQSVFHQVTNGDLSVRADARRKDELGSLAASFNSMTDTLLRRDLILESVRFAAQRFLQVPDWQDTIVEILERIGVAADANRASVYRNFVNDKNELCTIRDFEWAAEGYDTLVHHIVSGHFNVHAFKFNSWAEALGGNNIVKKNFSDLNKAEQVICAKLDIKSIILSPVFVSGRWWGSIILEDCVKERHWTDAEEDSLRTAADILGATIARQQVQEALIEAKSTLESRVDERTRELKEQFIKKEQALKELEEAQSSLLEMSRAAGMAEVATGVLHNVGNVLNSVNVSCTLLVDQLRESRISNISKLSELINQQGEDLPSFLTTDERGRQIPTYLKSLADALKKEHDTLFKETESLAGRIEHIKEIVAMQQNYGRVSGIIESIDPHQLMEDALMLNSGALVRHNIVVLKEYADVQSIQVDKHKVLQILLNLINNAKYACSEADISGKKIRLKIYQIDGEVYFEVIDNGIGISEENLTNIFRHGFTTRRSGHGFGLHSGALAARELNGVLFAQSEGRGKGATFTLKLPLNTPSQK